VPLPVEAPRGARMTTGTGKVVNLSKHPRPLANNSSPTKLKHPHGI
jgi:hypothetical protein